MIGVFDPVSLVLGVFGICCGVSIAALAGVVALSEFYGWRARRRAERESRRVTTQRARFADFEVDVSWEWPGAR